MHVKKTVMFTFLLAVILSSTTFFYFYYFQFEEESNLKAEWYSEALEALRTRYTKIKIAIVWSEKWENEDGTWSDLRINSSEEALKAYKEGISPDYFIGKDFLVPDRDVVPIDNHCFLGAFPGWGEFEDNVVSSHLNAFEELSGKPIAFVPFSVYWGRYMNQADMTKITYNLEAIREYGAIPLLRLMPWGNPFWEPEFQPQFSLENIINGSFDGFLNSLASIVKDYGKTVFVTFGVEMNGNWFPWSGIFQGADETDGYGDPNKPDGPERYVDAYRHVVEIFWEGAVDNAIWYFQPNHDSWPKEDWNNPDEYYPGDEYVQWVGFSLYGAQTLDEAWIDFETVMQPAYYQMVNLFPNKPLMLSEWGVMER